MTGVLQKGGAVTGVRTPYGDIEGEYVVNCAGMWARQLGAKSGREHPAAGGRALLPHHRADPRICAERSRCSRIPASYGYFREEVGGLMVGLFEPVCAPWKVGGVPEDFSFGEIAPDWDRMAPYVEKAMARVPRHDARSASRSSSAGPRASRPTCSRSSARRRS